MITRFGYCTLRIEGFMLKRKIQFKICDFCTLLQIFVYDPGPRVHAPHITNDFFLQNRSPNKYIGKVDKLWFIRYITAFVQDMKMYQGGSESTPPALNRVKKHLSGSVFIFLSKNMGRGGSSGEYSLLVSVLCLLCTLTDTQHIQCC